MTTVLKYASLLSALALGAASVAHADLADIKKRGELRVVMSGEYPPFSQPGPDGGLVGFDVDVAREIGRRLGVKVNVIKAEFPSIIAGLQAGQFDMAVASQSKTPERERAVDFLSRPYYYDGFQLFVPANSTATSLNTLGALRSPSPKARCSRSSCATASTRTSPPTAASRRSTWRSGRAARGA